MAKAHVRVRPPLGESTEAPSSTMMVQFVEEAPSATGWPLASLGKLPSTCRGEGWGLSGGGTVLTPPPRDTSPSGQATVMVANPDALAGPSTPLRTTWVLNADCLAGIGVPTGTSMGVGVGWTSGGTVEAGAGPLPPAGRCPPGGAAAWDEEELAPLLGVAAPVEGFPVAFDADVAGDVAVPEAAGVDDPVTGPGSVTDAVSVGVSGVSEGPELALSWTPEGEPWMKITTPKTAMITTAMPRAQRDLDD
jgi:hypothetical protein